MLKGKHSCISIGFLCHPMSRRVEKAAPSVLQVHLSPSLTVCSYITNDNHLTLTFLKEEKIESRDRIFCENNRFSATLKKLRR